MNTSKKAMSTGFLVTMILVVVAFMFVAGTIFRFMSKAEDKQSELLCRDSVALKAAATINIKNVGEAKLSPVLCKTIDKKISGNREEIKKEVADKMARCWWMFNEGRYNTNVFDNLNIFGGANKCFVCYTVLIEESGKFGTKHTPITSQEFSDFLSKTKYYGFNSTYLDYIQHSGGPGSLLGLLSDQGIQPNRAYAIAYQAKAGKCEKCGVKAAIGGTIIGGVAAALYIFGAPVTIPLTFFTLTGSTLLVKSSSQLAQEKFTLETELDTIILTDISNEQLYSSLANGCNLVEDIAGN